MGAEPARETKKLLLRLDPELARQLQAVAQVEGQSVSDVIRTAIAAHVERRRRDRRFQRLLQEHLAEHAELLKGLDDDR